MKKLYLYPLWVRIWHWLNALMCVILLLSGMNLHFASKEDPLVSFDNSIWIHNVAGITMAVLYVVFIIGNLVSHNGVHYKVKFRGFIPRFIAQLKYYGVGIFKGEPHPATPTEACKFNALQQITYVGIMYGLVSLLVISGVLLLFPESIPDNFMGIGTILPIAVSHTILSYFIALFLVGHLYLATTGETPLSNYKTMVTGIHYEPDSHELGGTSK
jgi:thiosulfate reductase cytochrome b subunit